MMTTLKFFLLLILSVSLRAGAHGNDKLGPHGGYIQMPGAYHTEVVPAPKDELKVYLLDFEWKNPTTRDSSVTIMLPPNQTVNCTAQDSISFSCPLPAQFKLSQKGTMIVKSKREGQTGNDAFYTLPLRVEPMTGTHVKPKKPLTPPKHSGHTGH